MTIYRKIPAPKNIWIELTNICNLKCSWCFQSTGSMNRRKGMMTLETYKRIVSEVESFKPNINLHLAGESFLHKDIFMFIEHAKRHGLVVGITTNGTMLRNNNFAILKTGIDTINISLAGIDKEDYLNVRGMDNFYEIKQDIISLANKKIDLKSTSKIFLNVTETKQNSARIGSFKSEFELIDGIDLVFVRPLMDWHGSVDTVRMKRKDVPFKAKMARIIRENYVLFSIYLFMTNVYHNKRLRNRTYCASVNESLGILWDGTVVPCCLDYNGSINLGNINEKIFMDIWNGESMMKLRKTLASVRSARHHPVCGPCLFPNRKV